MAFSATAQDGKKKQVKARCQRVKLQLLISSAGESISTVFKCIIKEVLFATTGGRQRTQNPGCRIVIRAPGSCLCEISISSVTDCCAVMSRTMT